MDIRMNLTFPSTVSAFQRPVSHLVRSAFKTLSLSKSTSRPGGNCRSSKNLRPRQYNFLPLHFEHNQHNLRWATVQQRSIVFDLGHRKEENSSSRARSGTHAEEGGSMRRKMNPCEVPVIPTDVVGDGRWMSMHNRYVQEVRQSEPEVVFIGDSIIQQMQFSTLWAEKLSPLHCLNLGIGGDRVENVLWRILNGELDFNTKIKAVVLFVGTNNFDCTPHEVFEGIVKIVEVIRGKLGGETAILIPTLLPKGQYPNAYRERNAEVNVYLLDKYANKDMAGDGTTRNVYIVPIHENILQSDQTISHHIMYDYLHLTDTGYTKVFTPVYEKLCEILKK